jgi:hypothetical protein
MELSGFESISQLHDPLPKKLIGSLSGVGMSDERHGEGLQIDPFDTLLFKVKLFPPPKTLLFPPLRKLRAGLSANDISGDFWKKFDLDRENFSIIILSIVI